MFGFQYRSCKQKVDDMVVLTLTSVLFDDMSVGGSYFSIGRGAAVLSKCSIQEKKKLKYENDKETLHGYVSTTRWETQNTNNNWSITNWGFETDFVLSEIFC